MVSPMKIPGRPQDWFLDVALLSLAIFFIYQNNLSNAFIVTSDDSTEVFLNSQLSQVSWDGIVELFTKPRAIGAFAPIKNLTFLANYSVKEQMDPLWFHLGNDVIHWLTVVVCYAFLQVLTKSRSISLFASLVFAVHPSHSAAINHVASRGHLLVGLFALTTLFFFLVASEAESKIVAGQPRWKSLVLYVLSYLSFGLGVLSFPTIWTVPFVLLVHEAFSSHGKPQAGWGRMSRLLCFLPFFVIQALYMAVHHHVQPLSDLTFSWNVYGASYLYRWMDLLYGYLFLSIVPPQHDLADARFLISTHSVSVAAWHLVLLAIVALAIIRLARIEEVKQWVPLAVALWMIPLLPHLIFAYVNPDNQATSQRYLYLPSLGIYVLAVGIWWAALRRLITRTAVCQWVFCVTMLVLIAGLSLSSSGRVYLWKSDGALFTSFLSKAEEDLQPQALLWLAAFDCFENRKESCAHTLERADALLTNIRKVRDGTYFANRHTVVRTMLRNLSNVQ